MTSADKWTAVLEALGLPAGKGCAVNGPDGTLPSTASPIFRNAAGNIEVIFEPKRG